MPTPATADWPRPKSEDEFEDIVLDALRILWRDPNATRYGRRGQKQSGVDVVGRIGKRFAGAQSKNVDTLSESDVMAIVAEAETYHQPLSELVVAISGRRDAKLQRTVHSLSGAREESGKFAVRLLFWDDICGALSEDAKLVSKYWSGWVPAANAPRPLVDPPHTFASGAPVSPVEAVVPFSLVPNIFEPEVLVPGTLATPLVGMMTPPNGPVRAVSVIPYWTGSSLTSKSGILPFVRAATVQSGRGFQKFPMMPREEPTIRDPRGVCWDADTGQGWHTQFAVGFDGSFTYRESIAESMRVHQIWGSGVGIFSTLDRVIGAVLFARRLLGECGPKRGWLLLDLRNVQGQRLAFDYDDPQPRMSHLIPAQTNKSNSIRVGLNFDVAISDENILELALEVADDIAYYFGWEPRRDWMSEEIRKIVEDVQPHR